MEVRIQFNSQMMKIVVLKNREVIWTQIIMMIIKIIILTIKCHQLINLKKILVIKLILTHNYMVEMIED